MWFGDRLRLLREEMGLSQVELAKKLNLTRATISKYENSKQGELDIYDNLIAMSILFDKPVDYILGLTDCRERYPAAKPVKGVDIESILNELNPEELKVIYEHASAIKKRNIKESED